MRRFLAWRLEEKERIYRLLDYASRSPGRGRIHLLVDSATEIGFSCDSEQEGWIRAGLSPLCMTTRPIQHFQEAVFRAWQIKVKVFRRIIGLICLVLVSYLSLLIFGDATKCCGVLSLIWRSLEWVSTQQVIR